MFIQHRSVHEFTSIATMHTSLTAVYVPEQMEPGCHLLDNFCQLFATYMVCHRTGLIENPERRSVSHQDIGPHRDFVPMSTYRRATLYIECPVVERRLHR